MRENYLQHHGILGQRWGVRRYENPDGTLTEAGRKRYKSKIQKSISKGEWVDPYNKASRRMEQTHLPAINKKYEGKDLDDKNIWSQYLSEIDNVWKTAYVYEVVNKYSDLKISKLPKPDLKEIVDSLPMFDMYDEETW